LENDCRPGTLTVGMVERELRLCVTAASRDGRRDARERLIEGYLPLVRRLAQRYAGRGERVEDLVQVGSVALIAAVDRCDPARRHTLPAYVARCVEGEIRRHLRDRASVVRLPRRAQQAGGRLEPVSLDEHGAEERPADGEAAEDTALTRALVSSAARCLDGRERRVVLLRYFLDLSQAEVGREVGVSQVQVSRLLRSANDKMRAGLGAGDPAAEW
jgi:RNA polymerase sigma-B factor